MLGVMTQGASRSSALVLSARLRRAAEHARASTVLLWNRDEDLSDVARRLATKPEVVRAAARPSFSVRAAASVEAINPRSAMVVVVPPVLPLRTIDEAVELRADEGVSILGAIIRPRRRSIGWHRRRSDAGNVTTEEQRKSEAGGTRPPRCWCRDRHRSGRSRGRRRSHSASSISRATLGLPAVRALSGGWVTSGPEVGAFERVRGSGGARHAVDAASCTAGLQLALRALELPPRSRVLTPSMTFAGAVHAILQAGLRPVLVDVDPRTLMPTPEHVAAAAGRGPRPRAMVVMHYGGAPADVAALADAARLPLERVVEDAAHALWTRAPGGRDIGTVSGATCSASMRPRISRSARAAWSRRRTTSSPRIFVAPGFTV